MVQPRPTCLTGTTFTQGLKVLCACDPDLIKITDRYGSPPFWKRRPGFATLVRIILEQQVSLASAQATFDRLRQAVTPLTPAGLLRLNNAQLQSIGFSRQKIQYCRVLARAIQKRELRLTALVDLPDKSVREQLTALKGIGPWTANIYLLVALRRPDIWPSGDLALATAVQHLKHLPQRPDDAHLTHISNAWRPWRAVAARLLWHFYLSRSA